MALKQLIGLGMGCLLLGCAQQGPLSQDELQAYINDPDHGLVKTERVKDLEVKVTYRPTDLLVNQEIGDQAATPTRVAELRKRYGQTHYFLLSLSRKNQEALNPREGFSQYSDLVQVLSFRMGEFTSLVTSQADTIAVGDYAFQRTYGMGSSNALLFAFPKAEKARPEWVQFDLNEFGLGTGSLRFRFRQQDLEAVPALKFNQEAH